MLPISWYISLGLLLFAIGSVGVMIRRNTLVVFMSIELMLNAVNIVFAAFSQATGSLDGQIAIFFVMVIAAAEAAVGLAIILCLFRNFRSIQSSEAGELKR